MTIERLEEWRNKYKDVHSEWDKDDSDEWRMYYYIQNFMLETLCAFKCQSDEIADLKQQFAKKEDCIDYNNIKVGGTD